MDMYFSMIRGPDKRSAFHNPETPVQSFDSQPVKLSRMDIFYNVKV
jgi:hypothetical protein